MTYDSGSEELDLSSGVSEDHLVIGSAHQFLSLGEVVDCELCELRALGDHILVIDIKDLAEFDSHHLSADQIVGFDRLDILDIQPLVEEFTDFSFDFLEFFGLHLLDWHILEFYDL